MKHLILVCVVLLLAQSCGSEEIDACDKFTTQINSRADAFKLDLTISEPSGERIAAIHTDELDELGISCLAARPDLECVPIELVGSLKSLEYDLDRQRNGELTPLGVPLLKIEIARFLKFQSLLVTEDVEEIRSACEFLDEQSSQQLNLRDSCSSRIEELVRHLPKLTNLEYFRTHRSSLKDLEESLLSCSSSVESISLYQELSSLNYYSERETTELDFKSYAEKAIEKIDVLLKELRKKDLRSE